jgi:hypothetical protein
MTETATKQYPQWLQSDDRSAWEALPGYMRATVDRYVSHGVRPGRFLMAVLENNLFKAIGHADPQNLASIRDWTLFAHWAMPGLSVGSKEKVAEWIKKGGLKGD